MTDGLQGWMANTWTADCFIHVLWQRVDSQLVALSPQPGPGLLSTFFRLYAVGLEGVTTFWGSSSYLEAQGNNNLQSMYITSQLSLAFFRESLRNTCSTIYSSNIFIWGLLQSYVVGIERWTHDDLILRLDAFAGTQPMDKHREGHTKHSDWSSESKTC